MKWGVFESKDPEAKCLAICKNDDVALQWIYMTSGKYPDAIIKQVSPRQKLGEIAK